MSHNGVLAVDHDGIISPLVEHTHVHAQNIGEIYSAGHRSFVRTYDHKMIIVYF